MINSYRAAPGIDVLTHDFPVPGFGLVAVNAFVLHGREPVLVDTGSVIESTGFLTALREVIDPGDLKWIWLSHTDFDHIGALHPLLEENNQLKVLTTYLSVGIMSLSAPLPLDRVHLVSPGLKITLEDRALTTIRPPTFDNPATAGFYDSKSGALFSSDCFGALLSAVPHNAMDLTDEELRQGQVLWATVDSPWVHNTNTDLFTEQLRAIREIDPAITLSSHLPAAPGQLTERMLRSLEAVPTAQPFTGLDQAALDQLLAQMTGEKASR